MIVIALCIVFLLGFSCINKIAGHLPALAKIGLAFLVGIGIETIFMFIFDLIGIRFTGMRLIAVSIVCIGLINFKAIMNIIKHRATINIRIPQQFFKTYFKNINLTWLFFIIITGFLIYASMSKSLYWPTSAYDNVAGYDLMGKVIGIEGRIRNSLFEINKAPILGSHNRLVYPPLTAGAFAFCYLFKMSTSKLMTSLLLLFFAVAFYGLLRVITNRTTAIIALFFTIITPEFYAFSSLSTTNIPFAIYASLGMICLLIWQHTGRRSDLYLAAILIALSSWTRSEGIVFDFTVFLFLLFHSIKKKSWKDFIPISAILFSTFIVWNIFVRLSFKADSIVFIMHPFWDSAKFSAIATWVKNLMTSTGLYGITFYAFFVLIGLNLIYAIFKRTFKEGYDWSFLAVLLTTLFLYTFLYYQMDNSKMDPLDLMMSASYKRGLFAFIPAIWVYIFTSRIVNTTFGYLNRYINLGEAQSSLMSKSN